MILLLSCNMSDKTVELPNNYKFEREGGYCNIVTKSHKLIIPHAALDYSYNENYLMFVFDTVKRMPERISNINLSYLVIHLKKDSLSSRMDYKEYKEFLKKNSIAKELDLSIRNYPK